MRTLPVGLKAVLSSFIRRNSPFHSASDWGYSQLRSTPSRELSSRSFITFWTKWLRFSGERTSFPKPPERLLPPKQIRSFVPYFAAASCARARMSLLGKRSIAASSPSDVTSMLKKIACVRCLHMASQSMPPYLYSGTYPTTAKSLLLSAFVHAPVPNSVARAMAMPAPTRSVVLRAVTVICVCSLLSIFFEKKKDLKKEVLSAVVVFLLWHSSKRCWTGCRARSE